MKRNALTGLAVLLGVLSTVAAVWATERIWQTRRSVGTVEEIYLRACEERAQWPPFPSPLSLTDDVFPKIMALDDSFEKFDHWRVLMDSKDVFAEKGSELAKLGLPLEVIVFEEIIRAEIVVLAGPEGADDLVEVGRYPAPKWSNLAGRELSKYLLDELGMRRICWHTVVRSEEEATLLSMAEQTLLSAKSAQTGVSAPQMMAMAMSSSEDVTDFRLVQGETNRLSLSVHLPPEFEGADLELFKSSNLVDGAWTTVLETNAPSSGMMYLTVAEIPDLLAGGSSTNSGGGGGVPPPGGTNTSSSASSNGSAVVYYKIQGSSQVDTDLDGLDNVSEYGAGTDYLLRDTSGDGLLDGWAVTNGLDPLALNTLGDSDNDGYSNLEEQKRGTDPGSPDNSGSTGTVSTIRYYYDQDDRLTDCFEGTGSAGKTLLSAAGNIDEEVQAQQ